MAGTVSTPTTAVKPGPSPHFTTAYVNVLYATPVDQLTIDQVEALYTALLRTPAYSKGKNVTVGSIFG